MIAQAVPVPPLPWLWITQLTPVPAGNGSFSDTFVAVPVVLLVPGLVMATVKPIWLPALTVPMSALLATIMFGASTTMVALAFTLGALVDEAVAVFGYVPALAAVVTLEIWIELLAPLAMSPKLQPSTWVPTGPVIEQLPAPVYAGLMTQSTPDPAGSGSLRVTAVAVPGPALLTVTVKPIEVPVLTGVASASLVICSPGHCTVIDAVDCTVPVWLLAPTVAVFG